MAHVQQGLVQEQEQDLVRGLEQDHLLVLGFAQAHQVLVQDLAQEREQDLEQRLQVVAGLVDHLVLQEVLVLDHLLVADVLQEVEEETKIQEKNKIFII